MNVQLQKRECFDKQSHDQHVWHNQFTCTGKGEDGEYLVATSEECNATFHHFNRLYNNPEVKLEDIFEPLDAEAPAILDAREAYGNRVVNMRQQADMWNAYLDGRTIEAHDVPIMFVLTKIHRLGRMSDYADNYNDIDGYMQIAREVIGSNMIEATTAKEYAEKKAGRWDDENQRNLEETLLDQQLKDSVKLAHWSCGKCDREALLGKDDGQIPLHYRTCSKRARSSFEPEIKGYGNLVGSARLPFEEDAVYDTSEGVVRHRLGAYDFTDAEIDAVLDHYKCLTDRDHKPRHPYENVERDAEAEAMRAYDEGQVDAHTD